MRSSTQIEFGPVMSQTLIDPAAGQYTLQVERTMRCGISGTISARIPASSRRTEIQPFRHSNHSDSLLFAKPQESPLEDEF
jgi:hypothetical protein